MADAALKVDAVTIGEASKRVGLTPRAIRYYERVGLLEGASRSSCNYRLYDSDAIRQLQSIAHCRAIGMSLAEIRALCSGASFQAKQDQRADLLREQLKLTDARIRELLALRRELRRQLCGDATDSRQGTELQPLVGARYLSARR